MCHSQQPHSHPHNDDHRQGSHHDVCGASEEEDPPDPLSDAIFHPKPGGLIPPRQSFLGNENTFGKFLLNFLSQIIEDKDA